MDHHVSLLRARQSDEYKYGEEGKEKGRNPPIVKRQGLSAYGV